MPSEERLIELIKKGNESAFVTMYEMYSGRLFGVCLRYSKNKADAEDLLQESFVKIYENLKNFQGSGSLEGWLRRITVNICINHYRKSKNEKVIASDNYVIDDIVNETVFSKIETERILELIQELPEGYRLVFNLHVIEGYKHNEIAELLGFSENTSKTQLLKARKQLMEKVIKLYPNLVDKAKEQDNGTNKKLVLE
jgi:RNA polymerase sigma-70 factor (ECF subfamily)